MLKFAIYLAICSLLSEEHSFFSFLVSYISFSTNVLCVNSRTNQHRKLAEPSVWIVLNLHIYLLMYSWYHHFNLLPMLKGQCPDYAHARASSVFSSKNNRTVRLTRQDFLPDRTADRDLLFIFSSNILDFRRSLSSYIKNWLAVRGLIAFLSLAGPPRDPKISFHSL